MKLREKLSDSTDFSEVNVLRNGLNRLNFSTNDHEWMKKTTEYAEYTDEMMKRTTEYAE